MCSARVGNHCNNVWKCKEYAQNSHCLQCVRSLTLNSILDKSSESVTNNSIVCINSELSCKTEVKSLGGGCAESVSAVFAGKVSECSGQRFLWRLSSRSHNNDCCEKHRGVTEGCRPSNSTISAETHKFCLILEGETERQRERRAVSQTLLCWLAVYTSNWLHNQNLTWHKHVDILNWYSFFCLIYSLCI